MNVKTPAMAFVAAFLALAPASGQEVMRQGISLSGGAGVGWTRPACDYCRRQLEAGPVVYLQMTGHVSPGLALGAEANLWARDGEAFVLLGALGAVAHLYPNPDRPFFLKGGLAYLSYRAYNDDGDLVSTMPALQLGAGYRFQLSDGLAMTNFLNVLTSRFGTLRSDGDVLVENMGITSFQFGVALTRF